MKKFHVGRFWLHRLIYNPFATRLLKKFLYLCSQISTMRLFAYILSLYILVLTAIPCLDAPEFSGSGNAQITQNTTNTTQELPDVDFCSPFCACSCCVSSISNQAFYIDFTCNSFSAVQYPKYSSEFLSFNFASIWQPPKLS